MMSITERVRRLVLVNLAVLVGAILFHPPAVLATNGMNLEGYGPIATGMGGGSMAYDNGSAAMMNNPATLGMMAPGNRLDIAAGYLGPDITTKVPFAPSYTDADSTANAFFMPAMGWVERRGNLTFGLGMFAQGGMGTEYDSQSFMSGYEGMTGPTFPVGNTGLTGLPVRSEVSVGRLIIPVVAEASSNFYVGGSLDFVWAGMDLQMVMGGSQMQDLIASFGGSETLGTVSGTMISGLSSMVGGAGPLDPDSPVNWAYFNFSNGTPYTGKAQGAGLAGKVGFAYKATKELTIGATYHSTTSLGDLTTDQAQLLLNVNMSDGAAPNGTTGPAMTAATYGKLTVKDFEWPQQVGLGAAYRASDDLMIVADFKWINWREVMRDFHMTFTSERDTMGNAFTGAVLDATLFQRWKNQNVFILGAAYRATNMLTLRAGMNRSNNPIPDQYLNPLFPAITKSHYTTGAGLAFSRRLTADLSITYAPEVEAYSGMGVIVTHSQTNSQAMVSYKF